jgi:hypothetical protein
MSSTSTRVVHTSPYMSAPQPRVVTSRAQVFTAADPSPGWSGPPGDRISSLTFALRGVAPRNTVATKKVLTYYKLVIHWARHENAGFES